MAMGVDFSTPLTKQERAFLNERGRYSDIERVDAAYGGSAPDGFGEGDGSGPQVLPVMTGEVMASRKEQLLRELAAIEEAEGATDDPDDPDGPTDEDGNLLPYSVWKVPALDAELKRRELSVSGTKPEKVARLEEDDENSES